jgi:hypothetical protein
MEPSSQPAARAARATDGHITIGEILTAVNDALNGCGQLSGLKFIERGSDGSYCRRPVPMALSAHRPHSGSSASRSVQRSVPAEEVDGHVQEGRTVSSHLCRYTACKEADGQG